MSRLSDLQGVLKGLGRIGSCSFNVTQREVINVWENSYIKPVTEQAVKILVDSQKITNKQSGQAKGIPLSQAMDNLPLVLEGMHIYASTVIGLPNQVFSRKYKDSAGISYKDKVSTGEEGKTVVYEVNSEVTALDLLELDLTNEEELKGRIFHKVHVEEDRIPLDVEEEIVTVTNLNNVDSFETGNSSEREFKKSTKISSVAKERKVPATRIARVANFASLGVGLGLGIVAEASRRAVGVGRKKQSDASLDGSLILNEANAERIVETLCRVRGAALKMGQILSIQDGAVISPELQRIFDRVRESADFMPLWQLERVMTAELGSDWRKHFQDFPDQPFAAASIGG